MQGFDRWSFDGGQVPRQHFIPEKNIGLNELYHIQILDCVPRMTNQTLGTVVFPGDMYVTFQDMKEGAPKSILKSDHVKK